MLTVISAIQPKRAGRLFVRTGLSTSLKPFAQRCFRRSLAVCRAPLSAILFIVIVSIQLALNAYGYFFKKDTGRKAIKRKNAKRISRTQFVPERVEADVLLDWEDKDDTLYEESSQNIYSPLELQLSAMSSASTCIAPLSCEDSNVHLDSATSTRARRVRRLVAHLKQRTANDEPVHYHDKKIRKINSENGTSQTRDKETLVQDSSRSRILRISNQPLVRQVTHAVSSVFRTPLRLPKNTVTVASHNPESIEVPIGDVVTFTYPPYPVSKVTDSSDRKWPWQTREMRGPFIEA
ncbi:hypothetical protein EDB19DRAFT_1684746 [Suillus lakei]|nr:hypothetical protein EDB19DRAFT_1684746 [Suillus lakei]